MKMGTTVEKKLHNYFSGKKEIIAVYMFGSAITGKKIKKDIDIAILVNDKSADDTIKIQTEIFNKLTLLLNRKDIDVIILNNAPLLLCMEVLKNKKLIYERNSSARVNFEVRSELKYFDWEPMRKYFAETSKRKIKEGKFYYG